MDFLDTKKYVYNNLDRISLIATTFGDTKKAIDIMFCRIEALVQNPESEPMNLSSEEANLVNAFISTYINGLMNLNSEFTESTVETTQVLSTVFDNFSRIYENRIFPDCAGDLIQALVGIKQTLSAQIKLNLYLISHLQSIQDYRREPTNSLLSRKYYAELSEFLKRKTNHDSEYTLKDACEAAN